MSLISVDITSYDTFRNEVLARAAQGLGYDVDGAYGYQCWDLAAELWMNTPEFSNSGLYPQTGPNYAAEECWTVSRDANAGDSFDLIWNYSDVKYGDVIVIGSSPISTTGHIAFADENYTGTNYMNLLGQNQVDPNFYTGHIPTVTNVDVGSYFLGAFRYKDWGGGPGPGPGPQPITLSNTKFPWVLLANKLRNS